MGVSGRKTVIGKRIRLRGDVRFDRRERFAIEMRRIRQACLVSVFVVVVPHRLDVDRLNSIEFVVVEPFQIRVTREKFVAPEKFTGQVRCAEMARETGPIERSFDDGDDLEVIVR